jgi:hypothetical protein
MTVRIIDETPDPAHVRRISCKSCATRLEYVLADVQRRSGTDYSGGPEGAEYIVCPKCNKDVILRSW